MKYTEISTITLYHGTSEDSAQTFIKNGWVPNGKRNYSPNGGNSKYLYLTNVRDDALWFSNQLGENTVVAVTVNFDDLIVDPEDGVEDTVIAELTKSRGLPGKVSATKPIPPENFKIV